MTSRIEAERLFAFGARSYKGPISFLFNDDSTHKIAYELSSILANTKLLLHLCNLQLELIYFGEIGALNVIPVDFLVFGFLNLSLGPSSLALCLKKVGSDSFRH